MKCADKIWTALIVGGLAADVWLAATDRELLTHRTRTPAGIAAQTVLVAHFAGILPDWADPFKIVTNIAGGIE